MNDGLPLNLTTETFGSVTVDDATIRRAQIAVVTRLEVDEARTVLEMLGIGGGSC